MEENFETFVKKYWEQEKLKEREILFPIGSRYITDDGETNPADILKIGTWERFDGLLAVGIKDNEESDFNEIRKVVGEEKHKLTIDELAEHTHSVSGNPVWGQKHTYGQITPGTSGQANDTDITDISVGKSGSDTPHNNIQPTEVVGYMWIRRK